MNANQKFSRRKFVSSAVSASAISVFPGAQKLLGEFTSLSGRRRPSKIPSPSRPARPGAIKGF